MKNGGIMINKLFINCQPLRPVLKKEYTGHKKGSLKQDYDRFERTKKEKNDR